MDLDDQFHRYFRQLRSGFGSTGSVAGAVAAGIERMTVDFGLERDRGRLIAIWAMLHLLVAAPDLDIAFDTEGDRNAARDFVDMIAAASD